MQTLKTATLTLVTTAFAAGAMAATPPMERDGAGDSLNAFNKLTAEAERNYGEGPIEQALGLGPDAAETDAAETHAAARTGTGRLADMNDAAGTGMPDARTFEYEGTDRDLSSVDDRTVNGVEVPDQRYSD